jgi:hypothetical protein
MLHRIDPCKIVRRHSSHVVLSQPSVLRSVVVGVAVLFSRQQRTSITTTTAVTATTTKSFGTTAVSLRVVQPHCCCYCRSLHLYRGGGDYAISTATTTNTLRYKSSTSCKDDTGTNKSILDETSKTGTDKWYSLSRKFFPNHTTTTTTIVKKRWQRMRSTLLAIQGFTASVVRSAWSDQSQYHQQHHHIPVQPQQQLPQHNNNNHHHNYTGSHTEELRHNVQRLQEYLSHTRMDQELLTSILYNRRFMTNVRLLSMVEQQQQQQQQSTVVAVGAEPPTTFVPKQQQQQQQQQLPYYDRRDSVVVQQSQQATIPTTKEALRFVHLHILQFT